MISIMRLSVRKSNGKKKYNYNPENSLAYYEHYPNDVSLADIVANYKYDIYGRRIQKNVNGTIINFSWEGDNLALELDENLQPIRRYVYGIGKDDVEGYVELSEVTGGMFDQYKQGWYSYIKDQVGTIYKVYSDYTQQMIDIRTYDVFGNMVNQTGSSNGNLGFHSKYYDHESGLNYFYYRYYNPANGRFINEDPIGFNGGFNMYLFVDNDSVNEIDPLGLQYSPWGCYSRMMKQKKHMIKPIEGKWRLIFGEDECPAVKECKKRCRKAWDGYYADVNTRYAGKCTKWSLKFIAIFIGKVVEPFYFFLGETYVKTIVCGVLCKDEKYVRAFNAL